MPTDDLFGTTTTSDVNKTTTKGIAFICCCCIVEYTNDFSKEAVIFYCSGGLRKSVW